MTALEQAARERFRKAFPYRKFTCCSACGEHRTCGSKRLHGRWLCLDCHDVS